MRALFEHIGEVADRDSEREALLVNGERLTYGQLALHLEHLSSELKACGIKRMGIQLPNGLDWVLFDLAALKAGIAVVPVPLFFSPEQVKHLLNDSELDAMVSEQGMEDFDGSHLKNLQQSVLQYRVTSNPCDDDFCKVTYTSGSTGNPKGVCLSNETLMNTVTALANALEASDLQRHLCLIPFSTLLENVAGIYVPLLMGRSLVVEQVEHFGLLSNNQFDVERFCNAVEEYRAESLILLPQMLKLLVEQGDISKLSSLKFIAVGGGKVAPELLARADQLGIPVYEGYGLSECGSVVCLNNALHRRAGSVGKPLGHVQVSISPEGEVLVLGSKMSGYLNQSEAPEVIHTGDAGYFDESGYLFISGRIKNLIVSSFGRNISPEWVESKLLASPLISQIAVFGEAQPYLSAVVVPADNATQQAVLTAVDRINRSLPDYARVQQLVFSEPFSIADKTLTENGKLRRTIIERKYSASLYPQEGVA